MASDSLPVSDRDRIPLVARFLVAGFLELAVALIAAYLVHAPLPILLELLPTLN